MLRGSLSAIVPSRSKTAARMGLPGLRSSRLGDLAEATRAVRIESEPPGERLGEQLPGHDEPIGASHSGNAGPGSASTLAAASREPPPIA